MKILQSCASKSWGGLEMQTLKIARGLQQKDQNVSILCVADSKLQDEAVKLNVPVFPAFGAGFVKTIKNLVSVIKSQQVDIIHTHLSHDLWYLVPAVKFSGKKVKIILTKRMESGVQKKDLLHRFLYGNVTHIYAISNFIRDNVIKTCPVKPENVSVMSNAIDLSAFDPGKYNRKKNRRELGIDDKILVVGMIGRVSPMKGHKEFLEAIRIVKDKISMPFLTLIVGGASYGEDDFYQEILQLGKELFDKNEIVFAGQQSDVPKMLSVMDIFAMPSHRESFGNVLLEAMAMEVPVISCNSGGVPDIVEDEKCGLLVPPQNAVKLADAIIKLISEKKLREHFVKSASKRVFQYFDFQKYIEKLVKDYTAFVAS